MNVSNDYDQADILPIENVNRLVKEMASSNWSSCVITCSRIMSLSDEALRITAEKLQLHFPRVELFEENKEQIKLLLLKGLKTEDQQLVLICREYEHKKVESDTLKEYRGRKNYLWGKILEKRYETLRDYTYGTPLELPEEVVDISQMKLLIEKEIATSSEKKKLQKEKKKVSTDEVVKKLPFSPEKDIDETDEEMSALTIDFKEQVEIENKKTNRQSASRVTRHKLLRDNNLYDDSYFTNEQDIKCMFDILAQFKNKKVYDPCCGKYYII
jgi:hypothetical protein